MKQLELTHLVKSILGYQFDTSQVVFSIHENDTNRPKRKDEEDTNKRVDPNGCTSDAQLKDKIHCYFIDTSGKTDSQDK